MKDEKMQKRNFSFCMIAIYAIMTVIAIVLVIEKVSMDSGNLFNWGWTILSFEMVQVALSFKMVQPGNKAVVVFLGKPLYATSAGFQFVPAGICWLIMVPSTVIQLQIPGEPENIYKGGDDSKILPKGMVRPIRATTASAEIAVLHFPKDKLSIEKDVLKKPMTLEVSGYLRVRIHNVLTFVNSFKNIDELRNQLRDTFEAIIKEEYGIRTAGLINSHLSDINVALTEKLKKIVVSSDWGLEVEECKIVENDLTKTLNAALRDAEIAGVDLSKADDEKEVVKKKAEGESYKKMQDGIAEAENQRALNKVKVELLEATAKISATEGGREVLRITQSIEVLKNAKYSIVPGGGDLLGLLAGAKETLEKTSGEKVEKPAGVK